MEHICEKQRKKQLDVSIFKTSGIPKITQYRDVAQLIRPENLALKVFNISDKICCGADGVDNRCAQLIKQEKFSC